MPEFPSSRSNCNRPRAPSWRMYSSLVAPFLTFSLSFAQAFNRLVICFSIVLDKRPPAEPPTIDANKLEIDMPAPIPPSSPSPSPSICASISPPLENWSSISLNSLDFSMILTSPRFNNSPRILLSLFVAVSAASPHKRFFISLVKYSELRSLTASGKPVFLIICS